MNNFSMALKKYSWGVKGIWLIYGALFVRTLWERMLQNSRLNFWQDESLIVFVGNHLPWQRSFWQALKSMTAGMPWPFIEYWGYMQFLRLMIPLENIMEQLEFYLRLPLTLYSLIAGVCIFLMIRRLSRSDVLASVTTFLLVVQSDLGALLGLQMRFHSSAFSHTALSWCLLVYMLMWPSVQVDVKRRMFWVWLVFGCICGASHVYGVYSFILQLVVLITVRIGMWDNFELPEFSVVTRRLAFLIPIGVALMEGAFFVIFIHQGLGTNKFIEDFVPVFYQFGNLMFPPNVLLWFGLFGGLSILFLGKSCALRWHKAFIILMGIFQWLVIFWLAYKYYSWRAVGGEWVTRYAFAGLVPCLFVFGYLAGQVLPDRFDRVISYPVLVVTVVLILGGRLEARPLNTTIYEGTLTSRWDRIRTRVLELGIQGKVTHIIGARPEGDHSLQQDYFGSSLDHTWQIYTNGPFAVAPITQYFINQYGGRTGLPCEERQLYPLAKDGLGSQYAIDFCEINQAEIRLIR